MKASGQITASAFCTFPDKIDALRQQARGVKATPLPVGKVMTWCATGPKLLMPAQLELGGCLQQHMHALSVSGGWWSGDTPDCFCPRWPDGWMDGWMVPNPPQNSVEEEAAVGRRLLVSSGLFCAPWSSWSVWSEAALLLLWQSLGWLLSASLWDVSAQDLVLGKKSFFPFPKGTALSLHPLIIIHKDLVRFSSADGAVLLCSVVITGASGQTMVAF